jgi:hypothetical protein
MKRRISTPALMSAIVAFGWLVPVPAAAQETGEKVNQLIVYGSDPCPASPEGTITVCARKDEAERFRIPAPLRNVADPNLSANQAWTQRVKAYETVGASGINSCSPVGSGGASGCMAKLIDRAYAEKKNSSDVQFGKLIEEERAKRLQSVDADAAAEQGRVEQLEKAYDEKLKREREAAAADNPAPAKPATAPDLATPPSN